MAVMTGALKRGMTDGSVEKKWKGEEGRAGRLDGGGHEGFGRGRASQCDNDTGPMDDGGGWSQHASCRNSERGISIRALTGQLSWARPE
jgi:hypothetical protein